MKVGSDKGPRIGGFREGHKVGRGKEVTMDIGNRLLKTQGTCFHFLVNSLWMVLTQ